MEGSVKELAAYRLERAEEMLKAAEDNFQRLLCCERCIRKVKPGAGYVCLRIRKEGCCNMESSGCEAAGLYVVTTIDINTCFLHLGYLF